ncbi:hypothetical protein RND81_02G082000 [Saponaria officinalis]
MLSGRDMIGIAFTGSGKTSVFVLSIIMVALQEELTTSIVSGEGPFVLIVCPSRELASQTYEVLEHFLSPFWDDGYSQIRPLLCIGGVDMRTQFDIMKRGVHIVVATPGRLKDLLANKRMNLDNCRNTSPLPDTGQWLFLALNEKLPQTVVDILRAHIVGLQHFLMLFIMLGFSVVFESVKAPGLGLAARYLFTMAICRLLRAITFVSTILLSARPWCAASRFQVPGHPHPWAQKYYVPYASDANAIRQVIYKDFAYIDPGKLVGEYRPDWGSMSFLIDFLRVRPMPSEGTTWYRLLKKAGGGCNDLLYSGHMLVAVLTAMAWTEAYGGYSSALVWYYGY